MPVHWRRGLLRLWLGGLRQRLLAGLVELGGDHRRGGVGLPGQRGGGRRGFGLGEGGVLLGDCSSVSGSSLIR
jgi:hypothetical protein